MHARVRASSGKPRAAPPDDNKTVPAGIDAPLTEASPATRQNGSAKRWASTPALPHRRQFNHARTARAMRINWRHGTRLMSLAMCSAALNCQPTAHRDSSKEKPLFGTRTTR